MLELTNEQRKCLGIPLISDSWLRIKPKPSPHHYYDTYAFIDGEKIVKVIQVSDAEGREFYYEWSVDQELSDDGARLLPKTDKGKPQLFTASTLEKVKRVGMGILFNDGVDIINFTTEQVYYRSRYSGKRIKTAEEFREWLNDWCEETGEGELRDIGEFASRKKVHQKIHEGDFFRFKINRTFWGYGRILVDYAAMRKQKIPFWDIFCGKPLCVAIYHIATENPNLIPSQLVGMKTLPSQMIMDNIFFYGDCEIIGNIPLVEGEIEYTIHYGESLSIREPNTYYYQCGKTFKTLRFNIPRYQFHNHSMSFFFHFTLPVLLECIRCDSNQPYWDMMGTYYVENDLRNPKNAKGLAVINRRLGIKS